jgi:outer membrane protein OmpA-like peptidoglycan-associated protein
MRIISLIIFLSTFYLQAQKDLLYTKLISDCAGAVEIQNSGEYDIAFTGKSGKINDLFEYKYIPNLRETNSLYLKFVAPQNGKLKMEASLPKGKFQMIVFKNNSDNIYDDIFEGKATIERSLIEPISNFTLPSDSSKVRDSLSMYMRTNDIIIILFNTLKNKKDQLKFILDFEVLDELENPDKFKKVIDERKNGQFPTLEIQIRDAETGLPLIAEVNIKDKKRSNLYQGSDLLFSAEKTNQLTIKCNVAGYFFIEEKFKVHPDSSKIILVQLHSMKKGKSMKIEKLQFLQGTDKIYPGSELNLVKVKDFLLLNASLKIEIRGHVNNEGENDMSSKRLSRQRAKRVRNFFIASGVNSKRLSWKACSNKDPIYPNPKNEIESQSNRRVEIKVL